MSLPLRYRILLTTARPARMPSSDGRTTAEAKRHENSKTISRAPVPKQLQRAQDGPVGPK